MGTADQVGTSEGNAPTLSRKVLSWEGFNALLKRYPLPPPRVVHSVYRRSANP